MRKRLPVLIALFALLSSSATAQNASVTARVSSTDVYAGQSVLLEIDVDGSDSPSAPDLSALDTNFRIQDVGGGSRNSQSITIINGRLSRQVERGYTFRYQLVPRSEGTFTIPPLAVQVDGNVLRTAAIPIRVSPATEVADFKLRASLSVTKAYVGQPLLLTTTWYIGRNVDQASFGMPFLDDDNFEISDLDIYLTNPSDDLLELVVNSRKVVARRAMGTLDGREFLTVRFVKVVIPKQPGRYELPASTVSFRALNTVRPTRQGFGGVFGSSLFSRTVYEDLAVPSNKPVLEVSALPAQGRPANFSGLVGSFHISAAASPTDVRVGDPINLEVALSGPEYLDYVRLPSLSLSPGMATGFTIPDERPQGIVKGRAKIFTQSIRARSLNVEEIPAIALNYFNPETGLYEVTGTNPIPITVDATRMLTSADLDGIDPWTQNATNEPPRLAPNYEAADALIRDKPGVRQFTSAAWLLAIAAPPMIFLSLLGLLRFRGRQPEVRVNAAAQRALKQLQSLTDPSPDDAAQLWREYLGAKLGVAPLALTYADVEGRLRDEGASAELLQESAQVFRACDEARFSGAQGTASFEETVARAIRACQSIDQLEGLL
ncbi:MAG: BatD family protein [Acidobacteria bacterium]|nr:BatD family protein [Acidobacteriota bacterium]